MDKTYVNVNIFILKRTVFQLLLLCLISKPLAIRLVKAGKHNLYNLPRWFSRKTWCQDPDGRWSLKATCWFHVTQTQFKVYVEIDNAHPKHKPQCITFVHRYVTAQIPPN